MSFSNKKNRYPTSILFAGIFVILIILVVIFSFAFLNYNISEKRSETNEVRTITVNGVSYIFNTNLREVIKIPAANETEIKNIFDRSERICITFDNSSREDNAAFMVASFNTVYKTIVYYKSKGMEKKIEACDDTPRIEFRGPNTGARGTAVSLLDSNTILVQGITAKDVEKAADRLILIIFGISEIQ